MTTEAPLAGIRVLSLAEQYPGPYATLLLADLGADVVLVERVGGGDPARQFPSFYESLNRNKRSIALELKAPEGQEAFMRLASTADVIIEGYRPGTVHRLGIGYEAVRERNPRLVFVSVSGFGQEGPYRDRPAHDVSYQALAGVLHERLGQLDPGPTPTLAIGDLSSGMFATIAVLTGLVDRSTTGLGRYVDVSMTDGLVSWMTTQLVPVLNHQEPPGIDAEPGYGLFLTSDKRIISLSVAHEDWFWRPLCEVVGMPEHAELRGSERQARADVLRGRLADLIASRSLDEWSKALDGAGVPYAPVLALSEVVDDPHIRARGMIVNVPGNADTPPRRHVRQPIKVGGSGNPIRRHSPALGEHTREVLSEGGFSLEEIDSLLSRGFARQSGGL